MSVIQSQNLLIAASCLILIGSGRAQHIARWEACTSLCGEDPMDYSSEEMVEYDEDWGDQEMEPAQQVKWVPPPLSPRVPWKMPKSNGKMTGRGLGDDDRCGQYGNISSVCYSHGCQHYLNGGERCVEGEMSCETRSYKKCLCSHAFCNEVEEESNKTCSPDAAIFQNKLTCRRANTYYVYHPKQHCLSEVDSGDCNATVIHAVNFFGPAVTDQWGIRYMADKDSNFSNPFKAIENNPNPVCTTTAGVNHSETVLLFTTPLLADPGLSVKSGKCVSYPVNLCQHGEYLLNFKFSEPVWTEANQRCTEVRINNVPIIVHLDPFAVSGGMKCGAGNVAVMFVADGETDIRKNADRNLHLKGHDETIPVKGGQMTLQFCYGYDCNDLNFLASAFSLERLGSGTVNCTS